MLETKIKKKNRKNLRRSLILIWFRAGIYGSPDFLALVRSEISKLFVPRPTGFDLWVPSFGYYVELDF